MEGLRSGTATRPPTAIGGHRRDTACQRPALTGAPFAHINLERARLIGLGRSPARSTRPRPRPTLKVRHGSVPARTILRLPQASVRRVAQRGDCYNQAATLHSENWDREAGADLIGASGRTPR